MLALERWLEDFTNLDDAVPGDLILWNKMLVLAVAFGVSDEVLRQLADAVPVDRRVDENGMYYYPSYWWYYSHGSLHSPMSEMHDAYQATVAELASSIRPRLRSSPRVPIAPPVDLAEASPVAEAAVSAEAAAVRSNRPFGPVDAGRSDRVRSAPAYALRSST